MANNVSNDGIKGSQSDIYKSLGPDQMALFDAAIQTAFDCGREVGGMNMRTAMLSSVLDEKQNNLLTNLRYKAFARGKQVGELEAQGKTPEEISKEIGMPLKTLKKKMNVEEDTNDGSSANE